ncbi:hypothetical protein DYBT9275_01067 [Dyadobacter sp. CECT 9275]|uniref:Outermembrane protein n=1 Tax=Dyadobacter helix TaxID=2822344 RepID=A0A916J9I4_9BACT|nr:hypothetical protein [Dyadobacter sp. CECT 9275]CAG4992917.1 hypothetical protein DYBT9275_01067 [Dyadobacter sp. CECT 9275]
MRVSLLLVTLLAVTTHSFSQTSFDKVKHNDKGNFFMYWGWNRGIYTKSNIRFHGENYDFTLKSVVAKDRQSKFGLDPYLNPGRVTIPQYDFRVGYFFRDNYSISFGIDHMKYVMKQNQTVDINGKIGETGTRYDGIYSHVPIQLTEDFLKFEHTDGLNYVNVELRRSHTILSPKSGFRHIDASLIEGVGGGMLYPRTNTTLLNYDRYDQFHVAGYGVAAVVGLNITFFNHLFIQAEAKGGYINMPDIRTTEFATDRAKQHFEFLQTNILVGAHFRLWKAKYH